jgi:hypothetical protein
MMEERRYQALRAISVVLRVLAWIVLVGLGLVFVGALIWAAVRMEAHALLFSLMAVLYGVFGFIYLYAGAEGILVFLDIEANTRRTGDMLERMLAAAQPPAAPGA